MATLELDGTSLDYEDTGPGSTGETIAFSHGLLPVEEPQLVTAAIEAFLEALPSRASVRTTESAAT